MSAVAPPALSRREFLSGLAAGSLVLAVGVPAIARVDPQSDTDLAFQPDIFVAIDPGGQVTILAHRSEMGTGIRTALPMVVADELGADWDRVVIRQAIGDRRVGSQNTDGSRSIRRFYQRMRVAGATARTMLEQAAAAAWNVDPAECSARDHEVVHGPSGRTIGFGALVDAARALEVPDETTLRFKPKSERRYVGQDVPITDLDDIVTGRAVFGIDARATEHLHAVVARSPVLGGTVAGYDADRARAVPGVVDVIEIPPFTAPHAFQALGGIAVLATSTWAALQGRRALDIQWTDGANAEFDSDAYEQALVRSARAPGKSFRAVGDVDAAFEEAGDDAVLEADYYVPMLAHASMEPPCALANVETDASGTATACEVWAPTQNPQAAQGQLAQTLGLPPEKITVNVTLLGGGFGRKSKPDFIVEAAYLSRAVGQPVHVTWTREDDIRHDYYHAVAAVHMRAAVGDDGMPEAWLQRSAFPTIASTFAAGASEGQDFEMGLGFTDVPYAVDHLRVENGPAQAHVRIGWLRSVAHVYHAFGICCFPDELAHRAGRDPYAYLMDLLGPPRMLDLAGVSYPNHGEPLERYPFDIGRLRHVTERAAKLSGWGRRLPKGRGLGIACHRSFLSYCANVVEVAVDPDGFLSIPKAWVVIDAGTVVHPDRVRAQLEGAASFGASLALYGEITATGGRVDQSNFHDYPIARIDESPREVITEIVENDELPAGVGEVGVPPFAPALCNAIYAATGRRIRRLPISGHDLSWTGGA
jgi:isoquinoline 1-oxidoreductase beta subunit